MDEVTAFGSERHLSPKKEHTKIYTKEDDIHSVLSSDTKMTDYTFGKATPRMTPQEDKSYITRFSIREEKRLFGPRIKIIEEKNEYKSFFKQRKITTDFVFNPRFDKCKTKKIIVREVAFAPPLRNSSFHMDLRKREIKAKRINKQITFQTESILKPDPLKSKFW
mmetsp:Transcript_28795/g.25485  ORF Transcript_28795/g.25485 Transcript_28795/m.25485 type:complete len:165 (-) Transcript_28795:21-515(-)